MEQKTEIKDIIKCIEDEFDQDKVNEVFKPVYNIINDKDKTLQRKLQMLHNKIVELRKEFDGLAYFTDAKERNRALNRLKYHRKKNEKINKVIPVDNDDDDDIIIMNVK